MPPPRRRTTAARCSSDADLDAAVEIGGGGGQVECWNWMPAIAHALINHSTHVMSCQVRSRIIVMAGQRKKNKRKKRWNFYG
jgi:ribosomal protein S9